MAFPQTELPVAVELQVGGAWTDVTPDVYLRGGLSITRGSSAEGSSVDHGRCSFTLRNVDGRYSPRNPLSLLYGQLGRNTPVRVSVLTGAAYLALTDSTEDRATTPDAAALDITGDLDIRLDAQLTNWFAAPELAGKYDFATNNRSWLFTTSLGGNLVLRWSTDGATTTTITSTEVMELPGSLRMAVRATLDVNNGAGGSTVTFYTAPTIAGPWTQLGDPVVTAGITSIYNSTAPVNVGDSLGAGFAHAAGKIRSFELRDGIDGTVVANPDFTVQAPGATSFADTAGRTWTLQNRAEITNRKVRFVGEISEWPARWDVSGQDVWVPVEASGILRRLGQGASPISSTLRRRVPSGSPLAYWPMEEGRSAVRAYSPIAGVQPLAVSGLSFAADDTLAGSSTLPTLGATSKISGTVPGTSAAGWHVEMAYNLAALPATQQRMLRVSVGGSTAVAYADVLVSTAGIRIEGRDVDGTLVGAFTGSVAASLTAFVGRWNRLQIFTATNGATLYLTVAWRDVTLDSWYFVSASMTGTAGRAAAVSGVWGSDFQGMAIGHLGVFPVGGTYAGVGDPVAGVTIYAGCDDGFTGERATTRMLRLCQEEGIAMTAVGITAYQQQVGPQRPDTVVSLLGAAADADGGVLYEQREDIGLHYRSRTTLYNQLAALALDYTLPGQAAPPLEPTDDDQAVRNDRTVTRTGGSSARAVLETGPMSVLAPPAGVGRYDDSVTLNLYADDQADQIAWWLLHLGTADEARYPSVRVNLAKAPSLIDAACSVDSGDRITIANLPAWLPPGGADLMAQGYTETLTQYTWDIVYNCTPYTPWHVGIADDAVYGTVDTDGSQLAAAATAAATSISVAVTAGPLWTQDPADMPVDIAVGGEVVTATAIASSVSDAFGRTVSNGWGTADTGQAWTTTGAAASDFNVTSSAGRHLNTTAGLRRQSTCPSPSADIDVKVNFSATALPATDSNYVYLGGRYTDVNNCYFARLRLAPTSNTMTLSLRKRVAATETEMTSLVLPQLFAAGTLFWIRFQAFGSALAAKAWQDGAAEPDWQVSTTDTSLTSAGALLVWSMVGASSTNTLPLTFYFDSFALLNPQTFTVTRSINGVSKAQTAGADVRLAHPAIVAL